MSYTSHQPPAYNSTYVKSTSAYDGNYLAPYACNPAGSLTGTWSSVSWLSANGSYTNQKFNVDLGAGYVITRIYYENNHASGANSGYGAKTFVLYGTNEATAFANTTYATTTDLTELTCDDNTFDQHVALDQADPKYINVTNSTSYRYYVLRIADNYLGSGALGLRRIAYQTEDVIDSSSQSSSSSTSQSSSSNSSSSPSSASSPSSSSSESSAHLADSYFARGFGE